MRTSTLFSPQNNNILISVLILVTFLAFSPVLKAQFLNWGDETHVTKNSNILIEDVSHFKALLKTPVNGVRSPLSNLSFLMEHRLFGFNALVMHLNNLLLHMAVVILVFFFAKNLELKTEEAFLGALIFAIHPTKVEAVAWVSQRQELLGAVFYMASLLCYQKNKYWPSLILAFLALLANPLTASLPLVMLALDWFNGKKVDQAAILSKWPYVGIAGVIVWKNYFAFAQIPSTNVFQVFSLPYLAVVLIMIAVGVGIWFGRQNKRIVLTVIFYVLTVFLSLRFDEAADLAFVADHHLYLPSVGFCFLTAVGIIQLYHFLKLQEAIIRHLFMAAVVMLILGLMLLTFNQSLVWRDSVSLWKHQIKIAPHPLAYNYLADALKKSKNPDYSEIIHLYKTAISKDSRSMKSYVNLAQVYVDQRQYEEALGVYQNALVLDAKNKTILLGMGIVYQKLDKSQEAIDTLNRLLKTYPDDEKVYIGVMDAYSQAIVEDPTKKIYQQQREEVLSEYEELSKRKKYSASDYFNLGFMYEQVGGFEEAVRFYKKSLEINPAYEKSLERLANRYQEVGDFKTALGLYQYLVRVYPKNVAGYLNMGIIYNALGDVARARMLYQKTIAMDPKNADAYFNLGYLNEVAGDLKEALNNYEKAIEHNPQLAESYYNTGNVYAALGQSAEAIASYLKTVGIDKSHQNAYVNLSILLFKSRDFAGALRYLEQAQLLGYTPPEEYLKSLELYKKK